MTKLWGGAKSELERERENLKNFWKNCFWKSQDPFKKKNGFTMFDWLKNNFDQSNQIEAHKKF